jgi:Recombination endonuclease VII
VHGVLNSVLNPVRTADKNARYRNKNRKAIRKRQREWEISHPESKFTRTLLMRYRMTIAQYDALLAFQGGVCAICRRLETATAAGRKVKGRKTKSKVIRLSVDHDHNCCPGDKSCGKCIRGLLCRACNSGIGHLRDSPAVLSAALHYLGGMSTPRATRAELPQRALG